MQIPSKSQDEFILSMNEKSQKVRSVFLEHIVNLTKNVNVNVMLGDGTVSEQHTFDPGLIRQFYGELIKKLPEWKTQDISTSKRDNPHKPRRTNTASGIDLGENQSRRPSGSSLSVQSRASPSRLDLDTAAGRFR